MSFDDFPANPPENRGIFCTWAGWIKVAMFWAIAIKFLSGDLGTKRMGIYTTKRQLEVGNLEICIKSHI